MVKHYDALGKNKELFYEDTPNDALVAVDQQWYETDIQPIVGTSLILEVDLDSSSDDEANNLEDAGKVKASDNIINKLFTLQDPELKDEHYKHRVNTVGLTHYQTNLRRRVQRSTRLLQKIQHIDEVKNDMKNELSQNVKRMNINQNSKKIKRKKYNRSKTQKNTATKQQWAYKMEFLQEEGDN